LSIVEEEVLPEVEIPSVVEVLSVVQDSSRGRGLGGQSRVGGRHWN